MGVNAKIKMLNKGFFCPTLTLVHISLPFELSKDILGIAQNANKTDNNKDTIFFILLMPPRL
jgi:hypothetical protein